MRDNKADFKEKEIWYPLFSVSLFINLKLFHMFFLLSLQDNTKQTPNLHYNLKPKGQTDRQISGHTIIHTLYIHTNPRT